MARLGRLGFVSGEETWTPAVAEERAHALGLGRLSGSQWRVLAACREEAARQGGRPPDPGQLTALTGLSGAELRTLFPDDPAGTLAALCGFAAPAIPSDSDPSRSSS